MYEWILWIALLDNPNQGTFSSLEACRQVSNVNYQILYPQPSNFTVHRAEAILDSSRCIKIKKGKR